MQKYIILTVVGITGSLLAYHFMDDLIGSERHRVVIAGAQKQGNISSVVEVQDKLDQLVNAFQKFQKTHQEQQRHIQSEQTRLSNMLVDMKNKLEPMETTEAESIENKPISRKDTETAKLRKVAEKNFHHWMNETLQNETWNLDATSQINEQVSKTLTTEFPDVSLDDMQCSDRFCRATLSHESGELPDISTLVGKPPFTNDIFTVYEENGSLALFFTGPGETLTDLQSDAQQATQYNY